MRRLEQAGVALAFGGLAYFGSHTTLTDGFDTNPNAVRGPAQACVSAAHLGEKAIQTSDVPKECNRFEYTFARVTTTVESYDPNQAASKIYTATVNTVYTLPVEDAFTAKVLSEATADSRIYHERRLMIDIGLGLTTVMAIAVAQRQQERRDYDQRIIESWLKDDSNS
jgi:hypothetical protein